MHICDTPIPRGKKTIIDIPIGHAYDGTLISMQVIAIRGKEDGPSIFISGAIHGDELTGPAVINELLNHKLLTDLRGLLLLVPVVNPFGFAAKSRYLPDRRDLNRCFPGSLKGSLAHRIAAIFMREIVDKCDYGIDLHSAAIHRTNLPQIRTIYDDEELLDMAEQFRAPVTLQSKMREGSLRQAAYEQGCKVIVYEAGEALRIDSKVVRAGVKGCLSVLASLNMIDNAPDRTNDDTYLGKASYWLRAPHAGIVTTKKHMGSIVSKNDLLATVHDISGNRLAIIKAPTDGIIIGATRIPLANRGDAMFHVATFTELSDLDAILDDLAVYL